MPGDTLDPRDFFVQSYDSERLKTLAVWSCFADADLRFRPAERARTPLEHMVHQCFSEDTWMRTMLGVDVGRPALPQEESRLAFLRHYAECSAARRDILAAQSSAWWGEETAFFDVRRARAWVFVRRLTHSAHHRGQLTVYLRLLGRPLYSVYGPTADTGGLPASGGHTVYRYDDIEQLLVSDSTGRAMWPALPGPGAAPATE